VRIALASESFTVNYGIHGTILPRRPGMTRYFAARFSNGYD